jgi:hypothetical protein
LESVVVVVVIIVVVRSGKKKNQTGNHPTSVCMRADMTPNFIFHAGDWLEMESWHPQEVVLWLQGWNG